MKTPTSLHILAGLMQAALFVTPALARDPSLVLHYTFDTNDRAVVVDQSGNGCNATVVGATWASNGLNGAAMRFNGICSDLRRSDVLGGQAEGSVGLWMNARTWDAVPATRGLVVTSTSASYVEPGDGVLLGTLPDGSRDLQIGFGMYDDAGGGWHLAKSGFIPQTNRWYHLLGTWGPGGLRCYVNGVLLGTNGFAGPSPARSTLLIGRSSRAQSTLDGLLDDVQIYNRELSAEEVGALAGLSLPSNVVWMAVEGAPLRWGTPAPRGYGRSVVGLGTQMTASVEGVIADGELLRHVCTGWLGTGDVPASGTSTSVAFTIRQQSVLTWLWADQYWVDILANGNGRTDVSSGWFTASNVVNVTAVPDAGYRFERWMGTIGACQSRQNPLALLVNGHQEIAAEFVPLGPNVQSGLLLHYTFDSNTPPEVLDESGHGLTGSRTGGTWVSNGVSGAAMQFEGVSSFIRRPDVLSGLGEGTVSVWFNPRSWLPASVGRVLIATTVAVGYVEPGDGLVLGSINDDLDNDRQIRFGIYDYDARVWHAAQSGEIPKTNVWTHVLGTWGPDGLRCYVDGVLRGTNAFVGAVPARNLLLVGRSGWDQSTVDGALDDVRIYDRELTPADVQELHRLGFDQDRDGLENWWEQQYFGSPVAAAPDDDSDSDGLSNRREFELQANPRSSDTDGDGYSDGWEALRHSSLTDAADVPAAVDHDFEGDGSSNIGVTERSAGAWYIREKLDGTLFSGGAVRWKAGAIPVPADYDGDGHCDFAGYIPGDGAFYIMRSHDLSTVQVNMGWNGVVPVPADYDGDRMADPAIYAPEEARWYIQPGGTGQVVRIDLGWKGVIPVPADYDGDRKADVAIYAPAEGRWYIRESRSGAVRQVRHGWVGVLPVPGDYDGDGKADVAVYAAAESRWFVIQSSDSQVRRIDFGDRVAVPVPGDYDQDGRTDAALYVPSTGKWYILKSSDGLLLGGGAGAQAGIAWGRPAVTPAVTSYQVLKLYGLVP